MENTPGLSFFWNTIKSLLQGKVLYTPDTPAARLIMKEVRSGEKGTSCFHITDGENVKERNPFSWPWTGDKKKQCCCWRGVLVASCVGSSVILHRDISTGLTVIVVTAWNKWRHRRWWLFCIMISKHATWCWCPSDARRILFTRQCSRVNNPTMRSVPLRDERICIDGTHLHMWVAFEIVVEVQLRGGRLSCIHSQIGEITKLCIYLQANGTFDALARLKELADLWDKEGPRVWDFFQDSPLVNNLRVRREHLAIAAPFNDTNKHFKFANLK